MNLLLFLIIGIVTGWIASILMRGRCLGVIGSCPNIVPGLIVNTMLMMI